MGKEVHHIKTFTLKTDWRSLMQQWDILDREICNLFEARKKFRSTYLLAALGRELNIKEAKDVKCVRVYYNAGDEVLFFETYDQTGYMDFLLNVEGTERDVAYPNNEEKDDEELLDSFLRVYDVYDARKVIFRSPPDAQEVVINEDQCTWHFKKIPICCYDVFTLDPVWRIDNVTGMAGRFYELGYKVTEYTTTHIDGIIAGSSRFYYDHKGVLLKKIFMSGTPWGSIVDDEEEHWDYDYQKKMVSMKHINVRKNIVRRRFQYKLDDHSRIHERKDFGYWNSEISVNQVEGISDSLGHTNTLQYKYGHNGRLCEIKTVFCMPVIKFERIVYEYDDQGRLIAQRDYDDSDKIVGEDSYRYTDDGKIEVTCRIYKRFLAGRNEAKE